MGDPLSVLGAAVGVTSLIIQLTDECVKGYKLYNEASNLPQTHRYLLVRFHIEQQRFLNFALEAGILHADGAICSTLQINRSLLLGILAETKTLFESFAAANGRYEKVSEERHINWDDHLEPANDLMSLLCIKEDDDTRQKRPTSTSKRTEAVGRLRGLRTSITQTAKNLRTIVVEPKRLVWAAVGKESFENLISKVGDLNSFLIALLDSSQVRRLQDSMTATYLEILQLRNDVVNLQILVEGLSPAIRSQRELPLGLDPVNSALSQAALEEQATQEKKKNYLRHLAQVKIQLTEIDELDKNEGTSDLSDPANTQLPLVDFQFEERIPESKEIRTWATYRDKSVWIEWKNIPAGNTICPSDVQIQRRIGLLTDLLRSVKPDGFRAAPCLGYIKTADVYDATHFGIVFEGPSATWPTMKTLRELLGNTPKPSLSERMALCAILARCIHSLHAVNWLHKALRADNIVFVSSSGSPNLDTPFVSGFELSRPSNMDQWSEKPGFEPAKDMYRHPNAQSSQSDGNYRKSYDIYSLGIVLTEIALWKRIEDVLGLENLSKVKPLTLRGIRSQLLKQPSTVNAKSEESCLQRVASSCGDTLRDVVERCLTMDIESKPEYSSPALGPKKILVLDLVKKLEHIAKAV
ncbi:hypothetical protein BS50DRAFT_624691 [Corynespora cassiicola Philippines]|uniref:Protein kinase domain-containing protein n=1 Tax=Corynespora cassiicola Philippines TaxID=1448308 RepID=A0A2T2N8W8_CORCC|nr:hypothetical protein BS50DRAFT_624691 [Corynespora cassiicola Philippines]